MLVISAIKGSAKYFVPLPSSLDAGQPAWQPQPRSVGLDLVPPVIKTFPSTGQAGGIAHLIFSVSDASRVTREDVKVFEGSRRLAWFVSHYERSDAGRVWYEWRIPLSKRGHRLRFCIFSADRMGNRSTTSCSPLRVKQ
jgi:hypothetical protein